MDPGQVHRSSVYWAKWLGCRSDFGEPRVEPRVKQDDVATLHWGTKQRRLFPARGTRVRLGARETEHRNIKRRVEARSSSDWLDFCSIQQIGLLSFDL